MAILPQFDIYTVPNMKEYWVFTVKLARRIERLCLGFKEHEMTQLLSGLQLRFFIYRNAFIFDNIIPSNDALPLKIGQDTLLDLLDHCLVQIQSGNLEAQQAQTCFHLIYYVCRRDEFLPITTAIDANGKKNGQKEKDINGE